MVPTGAPGVLARAETEMGDAGARTAEEKQMDAADDRKRAAFIAQQALLLQTRIDIAEKVLSLRNVSDFFS